MSLFWRKIRKFFVYRILHADDTPHRIALGVAIGLFVGLTPTMGAQTVIAVAIAALLRANKAVCIPVVWVSNPFTAVPLYYSLWLLGSVVMPRGSAASEVELMARLEVLVSESSSLSSMLGHLLDGSLLAVLSQIMVEFGAELWVGCVMVGIVVSPIAYFATRRGVAARRRRRQARRHRRQLASATRPAA